MMTAAINASCQSYRLIGYGIPGCVACSKIEAAFELISSGALIADFDVQFQVLTFEDDIRRTGLSFPSVPLIVLWRGRALVAAWEGVERGACMNMIAERVLQEVERVRSEDRVVSIDHEQQGS